MPRNGGTVLRMRRYNPLQTATVPLGNTGVTPPPQQLTAVNIDAEMDFYGTFIILNEQVTLQNQDPRQQDGVSKPTLIDLEAAARKTVATGAKDIYIQAERLSEMAA